VTAAALFVFGAVVISTVDNVLRPMVMRRGAQFNPMLTILGLFGGIALFGFVGLFVGPIVLGVTKLVIELFDREHPETTAVDELQDEDDDSHEPDTDTDENESTDTDCDRRT
jgi:predicted PurR-regulated permease PerM